MELRNIKSFVTIAETMSFTTAADQLNLSQSALTQQLQALELELGVRLIDRTNRRRLSLTGPGQVLLDQGRRLLVEESDLRTQVKSALEGGATLAIGHMGSATMSFIGGWTREFLQHHPLARISFHDLSPTEQERRLERRQIDLAFIREPNPRRNIRLKTMAVYDDRLVLAAPSGDPSNETGSIQAYGEVPLVLYNRVQAPWLNQAIEGYLFQNGIAPRVVLTADGMLPLLLTVASGQGYALIPSCLKHLRVPGVTFIELSPPAPPLSVLLAWVEENKSPLLKAFIEFIAPKAQDLSTPI